jgi:hypothetical protein
MLQGGGAETAGQVEDFSIGSVASRQAEVPPATARAFS